MAGAEKDTGEDFLAGAEAGAGAGAAFLAGAGEAFLDDPGVSGEAPAIRADRDCTANPRLGTKAVTETSRQARTTTNRNISTPNAGAE